MGSHGGATAEGQAAILASYGITEENVGEIVKNYDLVVDCVDRIDTRYILNDECRIQKKDLVSASSLRWEGQVHVIPSEGPCYRCMFPEAKTGCVMDCSRGGVLGSICGVIGSLQATEAVKLIVGIERKNKFITFNGITGTYHRFQKEFSRCSLCLETKKPFTIAEKIPSEKRIDWKTIISFPSRYTVLDIREPDHFRMFRYKGSRNCIPEDISDEYARNKSEDKITAIVCYRGITSEKIVKEWEKKDVLSVADGIESLMRLAGIP
jgi:adenylyltransferase/sulfurtransferase